MKNKQKSSLAPISNNSQTDETPAMETLKNTSKKFKKGTKEKLPRQVPLLKIYTEVPNSWLNFPM